MKAGAAAAIMLVAAAACSTPQSRIRKNQAAFDSYPPAIQGAIQKGEVEVGFTPKQTLMALGKPDRKYRVSTSSETLDIWSYRDYNGNRVSLGVGGGLVSAGNAFYGSDVSLESWPDFEERARVVFKEGRVIALKKRQK